APGPAPTDACERSQEEQRYRKHRGQVDVPQEEGCEPERRPLPPVVQELPDEQEAAELRERAHQYGGELGWKPQVRDRRHQPRVAGEPPRVSAPGRRGNVALGRAVYRRSIPDLRD